MFENIDKILAQLSVKQKITGLVLILITIIIIILGGYYFKSSTDLKSQVEIQSSIIKSQQLMIDTLVTVTKDKNKDIIESLQDCQNNSIDREIEYTKKMAELRKTFYDELENIKQYAIQKNRITKVYSMQSVKYDTTAVGDVAPRIIKTTEPISIPDDGFDNIIGLIETMQKKIKK